MQQREHLTVEGLQEIVNLKASLNLGLSNTLKAAFPNTIPTLRPLVENQKIPHSQLVAGFTSGCFLVALNNGKFKFLLFKITQHSRDELLMKNFIEYLGGVDIII